MSDFQNRRDHRRHTRRAWNRRGGYDRRKSKRGLSTGGEAHDRRDNEGGGRRWGGDQRKSTGRRKAVWRRDP